MKIPVPPPKFDVLAKKASQDKQYQLIIDANIKMADYKGRYHHWDILRHLDPPGGLTNEQWWLATKLARKAAYQPLLRLLNKSHAPFVFAVTEKMGAILHVIDRHIIGATYVGSSALDTNAKQAYLINSLIEEAITSSQLEGASTTRKVAKQMLREGRKPRNYSEQMIYNNFQAMQFIHEIKNEALTPALIFEIHRIVTQNTLDYEAAAGAFRKPSDEIHVVDVGSSAILHTPPGAEELPERLKRLCQFANESREVPFIHPMLKGIFVHFMLAYDHPFVDGNGRTARALFYWMMAKQQYPLMEYISISKIIKKAPAQYAKAFLYTETDDSDLTYFIHHQMNVVSQALEALCLYLGRETEATDQLDRLLKQSNKLHNPLNHRQLLLLKHALQHPSADYKIEAHRQAHNITYETARTDLVKLFDLGWLDKRQIGKAFVFTAVKDLDEKIGAVD